LVHAKFTEKVENKANHFFRIFLKDSTLPCHLYIRPGTQDFIKELSKYYELVIFTASQPSYATKVIEIIDPDNLVAHILYRDS
jgi:TFIIF-interacting CTD phosphatase-like protein